MSHSQPSSCRSGSLGWRGENRTQPPHQDDDRELALPCLKTLTLPTPTPTSLLSSSSPNTSQNSRHHPHRANKPQDARSRNVSPSTHPSLSPLPPSKSVPISTLTNLPTHPTDQAKKGLPSLPQTFPKAGSHNGMACRRNTISCNSPPARRNGIHPPRRHPQAQHLMRLPRGRNILLVHQAKVRDKVRDSMRSRR